MNHTVSTGEVARLITDPDSAITGYDWDFDGNGTTDASTTVPTTTHTYAPAGIHLEVEAETPDHQYFDYLYSSHPVQAAQFQYETASGITFMNLRMHWIAAGAPGA